MNLKAKLCQFSNTTVAIKNNSIDTWSHWFCFTDIKVIIYTNYYKTDKLKVKTQKVFPQNKTPFEKGWTLGLWLWNMATQSYAISEDNNIIRVKGCEFTGTGYVFPEGQW